MEDLVLTAASAVLVLAAGHFLFHAVLYSDALVRWILFSS
jgi:hypothetical protein